MTQPQTTDQGNGQVLAAAAIALALIAVEARVRQDVQDAIATAYKTLAAAAVIVASTAPATVITGLGLLSLPAMHKALLDNLNQARQQVTTTIRTGYTGAAQVALSKITADLAPDYQVPADLPDLGTALSSINADVDTMFGHAQTQLQQTIADAFDGIHGDNPGPARVVAINQAITNDQNSLQNRAAAAAGTAVQRGSTDTQQAIYNEYQTQTGTPGLMKRWKTTSTDPCGMCAALNGTMVGINAEFDYRATDVDKDLRPVWKNLLGPPRHPNCRCQLELVKT